MRKAACTIYFRLHVLMNIVFYGIKISSSHHELEPHDILRVLSFMLLIITKVTVDRNEVISTVFYILCVLSWLYVCCFFLNFNFVLELSRSINLSWEILAPIPIKSLEGIFPVEKLCFICLLLCCYSALLFRHLNHNNRLCSRDVRVYPYQRVYPTRPVPAGTGRVG